MPSKKRVRQTNEAASVVLKRDPNLPQTKPVFGGFCYSWRRASIGLFFAAVRAG